MRDRPGRYIQTHRSDTDGRRVRWPSASGFLERAAPCHAPMGPCYGDHLAVGEGGFKEGRAGGFDGEEGFQTARVLGGQGLPAGCPARTHGLYVGSAFKAPVAQLDRVLPSEGVRILSSAPLISKD